MENRRCNPSPTDDAQAQGVSLARPFAVAAGPTPQGPQATPPLPMGPSPLPPSNQFSPEYPRGYDPEKIELLFDGICEGTRSVSEGLVRLGINQASFYRWVRDDRPSGLRARYNESLMIRAHRLFDEAEQISRVGSSEDYAALEGELRKVCVTERRSKETGEVTKSVNAKEMKALLLARNQDIRNRLDFVRWACGKLFPKMYGDRLELDGKIEHDHKLKEMPADVLMAVIVRQARALGMPVAVVGDGDEQ